MIKTETASEVKGKTMKNRLMKNLGITENQIKTANDMIAQGYGRDAVAEELNLHRHFRTCEYSRILEGLVSWN